MRSSLWSLALVLLAMGCTQEKFAEGSTDGAAIYQDACFRCHGYQGVPDKGMAARTGVRALTSDRVRNDLSDDDIRKKILNGSASKTMPAFQGALNDAQITALIAYVRGLAQEASATP